LSSVFTSWAEEGIGAFTGSRVAETGRAAEEDVYCERVKGREELELEVLNKLVPVPTDASGAGGSTEWAEQGLSAAVVGVAMEGMMEGMAEVISDGSEMIEDEKAKARA
jgi:hypothetical protein